MYKDLTVDKLIKEINKLHSKYNDGLINNINFVLQEKDACRDLINQEKDHAEKIIAMINEG